MADEVEVFARHAVQMERVKAAEAKQFAKFAKEIDRIIRERFGGIDLQALTPAQVEQLVIAVENEVRAQVAVWSANTQAAVISAGVYEAQFTARALNNLMVVRSVVPAEDIVRAVVAEAVFASGDWKAGMKLSGAFTQFTDSASMRLANQIRLGYFEGKTTTQMVGLLRGLASNQYRDGQLALLAQSAEVMAKDAFQLATGAGKLATLKANDIDKYEWVSVLDDRTSTKCRALDSRVFTVGKGPLPPLHPRCRSTVAPVLPDRLRDELADVGTRNTQEGPVDSGTSYYTWLKQQDTDYIESVLGPSRTALLIKGDLTADRFAALQLNRNFEPLTLDEMRKIEPLAFKKAGLVN